MPDSWQDRVAVTAGQQQQQQRALGGGVGVGAGDRHPQQQLTEEGSQQALLPQQQV
jgi:hypothetical protein